MKYIPGINLYEGRKLTPLRAIAAFCKFCSGDDPREVKLCPSVSCPLYPYRLGRLPENGSSNLLAVIKSYCFGQCLPGGYSEVVDCGGHVNGTHPACPLWPYRLGTNLHFSAEARKTRSRRAKNQPRQAAQQGKFGMKGLSKPESRSDGLGGL